MNLLEAALSGSVLNATLNYLANGVSVMPCTGKRPVEYEAGKLFPWQKLQTQRVPFSYVHNWHSRGWLQNVGIITGAVSGNLVVVDLDGEKAVEDWYAHFNYTTFTVLSGSGKGRHVYFYAQSLPTTTRTKGYELRANGCYVIAPPSVHPDSGKPYSVAVAADVLIVDNLRDVQQWIRSKMPVSHTPAGNYGNREATPRNDEWSQRALQKWHDKALENEALKVRTAQVGERNKELFRATLRLARMEGISLSRVRETMLTAAHQLASDDGLASVERTIASAMRIAEGMDVWPAPKPFTPKYLKR